MKILHRLREQATEQSRIQAMLDAYDSDSIESRMDTASEELLEDDFDIDFLGIGAAMEEDVVWLEFMDHFRRRIPDIHEDIPPNGLVCDQFATELDS